MLVVKAKLDFRRFVVPLLFTIYSGWGLGINISNLFCQWDLLKFGYHHHFLGLMFLSFLAFSFSFLGSIQNFMLLTVCCCCCSTRFFLTYCPPLFCLLWSFVFFPCCGIYLLTLCPLCSLTKLNVAPLKALQAKKSPNSMELFSSKWPIFWKHPPDCI